jgi:hypothetical protein
MRLVMIPIVVLIIIPQMIFIIPLNQTKCKNTAFRWRWLVILGLVLNLMSPYRFIVSLIDVRRVVSIVRIIIIPRVMVIVPL